MLTLTACIRGVPHDSNMSSTQPTANKKGRFLSDIEEIRRRARQSIEKGAVTEGYKADVEEVVKILNEALASYCTNDVEILMSGLVAVRKEVLE